MKGDWKLNISQEKIGILRKFEEIIGIFRKSDSAVQVGFNTAVYTQSAEDAFLSILGDLVL